MQTIRHLSVEYWISKPTHLQTHARVCAPTLTYERIRLLSPTRARAHTQKEICNIYLFHGYNASVNAPQRTLPFLMIVYLRKIYLTYYVAR
jgi:hypothetical protein